MCRWRLSRDLNVGYLWSLRLWKCPSFLLLLKEDECLDVKWRKGWTLSGQISQSSHLQTSLKNIFSFILLCCLLFLKFNLPLKFFFHSLHLLFLLPVEPTISSFYSLFEMKREREKVLLLFCSSYYNLINDAITSRRQTKALCCFHCWRFQTTHKRNENRADRADRKRF